MRVKLQDLKIMFVDDSPTARAVLYFAYATWPNVEIISTPAIALKHAEEAAGAGKPYDAFILDVHMGPPDGVELARRIRALDEYRGTPVIFLTSITDKNKLAEAHEVGNGIIAKGRRTSVEIFSAVKDALLKTRKRTTR